jgi:carbonic anhydrase
VLGVLVQPGGEKPNPCLDAALEKGPQLVPGAEIPLGRPFQPSALLPKPRTADGRRPYATYAGSLTTPPCTEGVNWVVFLDPIQVQATQVLDFLTFARRDGEVELNARPTQPLGIRQLRFFV